MSRKPRITLHEIDPATVAAEIGKFIVSRITAAGAHGAVVGLSGGVDSSTVAFLAQRAFQQYSKADPAAAPLTLIGLVMPSATNAKSDEDDALEIARHLGFECHVVPIELLKDAFRTNLPGVIARERDDGNLASELRAIVLSRYAAKNNCLILGTGNRDEDYCLGYFTKRGDGAVDLSPIGALSKRHVRQVARHLGVPDRIVNKTPTAGLWHGQTDEGELGFTYEFAELAIAGRDLGLAPAEIAVTLETTEDKVNRVFELHRKNSHKMAMPEIAQVTYLERKQR